MWPGVLLWLAVCLLYAGLGAGGFGELWLVVPFIAALVAARVVERQPRARRVGGVAVRAGAVLAVLGALGVWAGGGLLTELGDHENALALLAVAAGLGVAGALTLAVLARPVRERLLPAVGLDPASPVHAAVAVLYGLTLVAMVALFGLLWDEPGEEILLSLADPAIALLSDVPLALAGVGWLLTRDTRATLERLGFGPIGWRQAGRAAVIAAGFLVAVGVLDALEAWLLPEVHAREGRFPLGFGDVPAWVGAPLVALAAGVGEEAVFRGALQPRIGIVASALLFAGVHVQYQVPGIAVIFLVGLALGVLRDRTSTTFTALTHMLYDIGAFLVPEF